MTGLAGGPIAEGEDRHDDERADHRHEMEQRQGTRVAGTGEDPPARDDQQQRHQQMDDGDDEQDSRAGYDRPAQQPGGKVRQVL